MKEESQEVAFFKDCMVEAMDSLSCDKICFNSFVIFISFVFMLCCLFGHFVIHTYIITLLFTPTYYIVIV